MSLFVLQNNIMSSVKSAQCFRVVFFFSSIKMKQQLYDLVNLFLDIKPQIHLQWK